VAARTLVIVNPSSRSGATGRRWGAVAARLRTSIGPFEVEFTRGPRDAARLARDGVRAGVERIVVAGGDGTMNEVATGLLAAGLGADVEVGVLPLGTGGDFPRSLGIPAGIDDAIALLARGRARPIDAGRIEYRGPEFRAATGYFVNVASFGISGLIDRFVNQGSGRLGGRLSFLVATLRALARYRAAEVTIRVDGAIAFAGRLNLAAVANGSRFGGGMRIAPDARLDDGRFDVVVIPDHARMKLAAKLPLIYSGRHIEDPISIVVRGRVIEAEATPGTALLDIDGEPLGSLPARIEVLPCALRVIRGPA
jgi:YegS/Rv2252/BmrU family lipid kinase